MEHGVKKAYKFIKFNAATMTLIHVLNSLIEDYQAQGYTLSVRQLYYQLVARDHIPNTEQSYKRIASIINDGRMAGHIDWDAIEDRNRDVEDRSHWGSGKQLLVGAARGFHMDLWEGQENRVFVVVEKAALAGVLGPTCEAYDIPYLAARGYPSVSIVREMALKYVAPAIANDNQDVVLFHLGDHDPSGIDMTRDLEERFKIFLGPLGDRFSLERIALTREQIDEENPPPNPAKMTDSRFQGYASVHGNESWELDALNPSYIVDLVKSHVDPLIDHAMWSAREDEIETIRDRIVDIAQEFKN